ncbi:hypothetical protein SND12_17240 [Escherichia coli]|nr:hypothetical protein [Escherichia coli]
MGSCAAPSAKGDDKFITTDYLQQCRSASFVEFSPNERPMQLFHMPNENNGKWQAAFHNFGCSPEFGEPEMEYIIFVGAYSNDRDCTFDLMREGLNRAWEIVEGNRQLRDGEFND